MYCSPNLAGGKSFCTLSNKYLTTASGDPATATDTPTPTATYTPTSPPPTVFANAVFIYDGDGKRVKSIINGTETTYFAGAHYEVTDGVVTKYYYAGAQRIAMRKDGTLNYLLGDHLGSTSLTTDASGNLVSELRYKAWGEVRYASGATPTDYTYTGQYSDSYINLLWYGSRHYDPELGRFIQPDSIVPTSVQGVQAYDHYAYTNNNPILYTDPSGHSIKPPPCWLCNKTFSYASHSGLFAHDGFINNALDLVLPAVVNLYPGGAYVNEARDTITFSGAQDYYPAMMSNVVMVGADVIMPTIPLLPGPTVVEPQLALPAPGADDIAYYVRPNGDVIPSTGYRYSAGSGFNDAIANGTLPARSEGTYITFDYFTEQIPAKSSLQIPYLPEKGVSFDTLQIIDDIRIPYGSWNTSSILEPIVSDFPKFGGGGATQAITNSPIQIDIWWWLR